jgi:hypothetical protein
VGPRTASRPPNATEILGGVQVCLTCIHSTINVAGVQGPVLVRTGGGTARPLNAKKDTGRQSPLPSGRGRHLLGVTRRDDSQASSWPSWIQALLLRERDEPTDLLGMCAFLHNSSVDLRDPA